MGGFVVRRLRNVERWWSVVASYDPTTVITQVDETDATDTLSGYRDLIRRHDNKLTRDLPLLKRYAALHEGEVPLKYMAPAVAAQFGDRISQLIINLPRYVVKTNENRLNIDGIRLDPSADADDVEQQAWADMDMPTVSHMAHVEALAHSRSYVSVGVDEDGNPCAAAESPLQVTSFQHPLTRTVTSAVKRWKHADGRTQMRTLYLPNSNATFIKLRGDWQPYSDDQVEAVDEHNIGRVLMNPFANSGTVLQPEGSMPEFWDIVPVFEALNKMATDMMVGSEFHALPRRWALNVAEADFEDENGNAVSPLEQIIGAVWAIPRAEGQLGAGDPQVGQFPASDLRNFYEGIKLLLQVAAMLTGLPPHYLAMGGDNPASAEAIRESKDQLITNVERKQTGFNPSWRRTWQSVMAIRNGGTMPESARHLQLVWRDAGTASLGARADSALKLRSERIISNDFAQEMVGLNAAERDRNSVALAKEQTAQFTALRDIQAG
jgi:hypothetical protein